MGFRKAIRQFFVEEGSLRCHLCPFVTVEGDNAFFNHMEQTRPYNFAAVREQVEAEMPRVLHEVCAEYQFSRNLVPDELNRFWCSTCNYHANNRDEITPHLKGTHPDRWDTVMSQYNP